MRVSVAMAVYNGEKYIVKQLASILAQTCPADEVIIYDDASTDDTVSICTRFIRDHSLVNWRIYQNPKNIGYCGNFYRAIEECGGDVIFLADQDDEWYPQKIELMLDCLATNPEITVLSSRYDVIDARSCIIEKPRLLHLGDRFDGSIEILSTESFIGCSHIRGFSLCFRKELKDILKPIELGSLLSHDWFICALATVVGKCAILNKKLCAYRVHGENTSLSPTSRKTGDLNLKKRISGILESIEGHSYLLTLVDGDLHYAIESFIAFERKRLLFLQNGNISSFAKLWRYRKEYNRYYKGKPLRVWLGDLFYRYFPAKGS